MVVIMVILMIKITWIFKYFSTLKITYFQAKCPPSGTPEKGKFITINCRKYPSLTITIRTVAVTLF